MAGPAVGAAPGRLRAHRLEEWRCPEEECHREWADRCDASDSFLRSSAKSKELTMKTRSRPQACFACALVFASVMTCKSSTSSTSSKTDTPKTPHTATPATPPSTT